MNNEVLEKCLDSFQPVTVRNRCIHLSIGALPLPTSRVNQAETRGGKLGILD